MRINLLSLSTVGAVACALLVGPLVEGALAQSGLGAVDASVAQSPLQLQTLVAPIALYPDPLIAQILQASTYPDQVSEAAVVTAMHPGQSVESEPWDVSVIAVSHYPPVLQMMAKQMNWTSQLGQAYLAQQGPVLQAIQALRQQAMNVGNLKTTTQQQVVSSGGAVQIYPTDPNMFYIPTYDPGVVYTQPAVWGAAPVVGFDTGWAVGAALAGTSVDWYGGGIVNYPPGTGWRDAYSNGGYHAVVGQTASGADYAAQSETRTLAGGGDITRYQGTAEGWDGATSGHGAVYSKGDTDAGTFSRTVSTDNGVYNIHGAAGTNGSTSGGYADVTGVNRDGQTVNDSITDRDGDITTSRNSDAFDSRPDSGNLFSENHEDWSSSYADRGSWSRDSFSGGGGGFGGFRGGGFRR
jgi:hypothetical protein